MVCDLCCEVCVMMDVEYGDGVVEGVWEDVVLACVSDGVLPHSGVSAYGRCEVAGVLGNIGVCGWVCCDYGLL